MLRTVEETAIQLGVSKTTIYNKLKMKEYKSKLVKKQGKSMVDDSLFNLIQEGLKVQNEVENKEIENDVNAETSIDEDGLLNLNKELIDNLLEQLKEKDKQISELHKLIENSQILLKEEQKKSEQQLYLAEHFEEVDNKLQDLKEKMEQKRNEKIKFFKIFSKYIYRVFFSKGKIMKLEKKKYFLCPMCGEKLKLPKTEELEVIFIKCSCGCGSFIQVRNGYHIPSKRGLEKVF